MAITSENANLLGTRSVNSCLWTAQTCNPCRQATAYRCPHFDRVDRQAAVRQSDLQIQHSQLAIGLQTFATGWLPRSGLVQRHLWNVPAATNRHSGLIFANLITLAHFSVWSPTNLPKSAGEPRSTVAPPSARRFFGSGSERIALISLLSLSIISAGVFRGAPTPKKALAS